MNIEYMCNKVIAIVTDNVDNKHNNFTSYSSLQLI